MTDGGRLSLIGSMHQSDCFVYTAIAIGLQLVLKADPRRYFVRFRSVGGSTLSIPIPGGTRGTVTAGGTINGEVVYKFADCPAIVQGEFYVSPGAPGILFLVETDLYVGR